MQKLKENKLSVNAFYSLLFNTVIKDGNCSKPAIKYE